MLGFMDQLCHVSSSWSKSWSDPACYSCAVGAARAPWLELTLWSASRLHDAAFTIESCVALRPAVPLGPGRRRRVRRRPRARSASASCQGLVRSAGVRYTGDHAPAHFQRIVGLPPS